MTEWGTGAGGTGRGVGGAGRRGSESPPTPQGAHHRLPCTSHCNPGFKQRGLRETLLIWPPGPTAFLPSSGFSHTPPFVFLEQPSPFLPQKRHGSNKHTGLIFLGSFTCPGV